MDQVSVVVLTMGDRPDELARAVESARRQTGVDVEVILVINRGSADMSLADVVIEPGENLGVPAGRNAGAARARGDHICFLDDDGELVGTDVFSSIAASMTERPELGLVALRIVNGLGTTARRHHPGVRGDPGESRDVTAFPGGACVVRRNAFEEVGGLCGPFFYGLEETDLSWRLIDHDWTIHYASDLEMEHPDVRPVRHSMFHHHTARNRVWMAHRLLPVPLALLYVFNWTLITVARNLKHPRAIVSHFSGTFNGLRNLTGPRQPIAWKTVRELSRLGRPPVL